MDIDPTSPEYYRPHPMGYACKDCRASASVGQAVRHTSVCDIAPKQFVLPSDQQPVGGSKRARMRGTAPNRQAKRDARGRDIARDAREGLAYAFGHTDADLALAVRNGQVSMSDAMNQDG